MEICRRRKNAFGDRNAVDEGAGGGVEIAQVKRPETREGTMMRSYRWIFEADRLDGSLPSRKDRRREKLVFFQDR